MKNNKATGIHIITGLIIALCLVTTLIGLLYTTGGKAHTFINQYGDAVKIYGDGLYAHDSIFKASTARGTDFVTLFISVPLLMIALMFDIKKRSLKSRLLLTSLLAGTVYYSASDAFGITYNILHLAYIALFSLSFFGLILAITSIDLSQLKSSVTKKLPQRGIYVFLFLVGIALIAAWLPDIITSIINHRSLQAIEVYTTEITYVLDMGIIAPTALICLYLFKKQSGLGYVLLAIMLTMCVQVGLMLPIQSIFEVAAGALFVGEPLSTIIIQMLTKVGSFVILAMFSLCFDIKLFRAISPAGSGSRSNYKVN
jgi:hypothetical protein